MGNPGLPSVVPGETTIVKNEQSLVKRSKSTVVKRANGHSAKPVETKIEPAIATLAHLQTVLEDYLEPKTLTKLKTPTGLRIRRIWVNSAQAAPPILPTPFQLPKFALAGSLT